jgi:hypothetical protein
MTPKGREEVVKQSAASGFPGDTYPLYENNCGANGGNHRGARALRVTFSTKEERNRFAMAIEKPFQ